MTLLLRHMSAGCTRFLQWRDSTVWFRFRFQFGNLVHILQRERDWTALFLSSIGSETTIFLRDRYSTTDQALALMTLWPDDVEDVSTGGKHGIGRKFYHFYKISVTGYAEPRLILKTFSASSDENFIKMTAFSFQCRALTNFPNYSLTIFWYFLTTRCLRYGCSITASALGGGGGGGGGGGHRTSVAVVTLDNMVEDAVAASANLRQILIVSVRYCGLAFVSWLSLLWDTLSRKLELQWFSISP